MSLNFVHVYNVMISLNEIEKNKDKCFVVNLIQCIKTQLGYVLGPFNLLNVPFYQI